MKSAFIFILTILIISCQPKNDRVIAESDESQILNLAFDKVIGSDTTYRNWLKHNPPPIPVIAFTKKIDSVEYLKSMHWRDSVIKILDTASLFVVVYMKNEDMVESYVNNLLDTIKQKTGDALFNGVLKVLCAQNWSKDCTDIALLKPKYNFKIINESVASHDPIRRIGSIKFSKIAFNDRKDTACVYTSFSCGEFCGKGDIHFFSKEARKWIYNKKFVLWSS